MSLNDRKIKILQAIINDYIETAEPIGSRTIAKKYDLGISSATIRNEMSDLEEMGLIVQPHASAGRVPSDKGYRFYVDSLMGQKDLTNEQLQFLNDVVNENINKIEQLMKETAKAISVLTNYTTVVSEPYFQKTTIKHLQLVPIDDNSIIVVMVNDANVVRNQIVRLHKVPSYDTLHVLSTVLNTYLQGHSTEILASEHLANLENNFGEYKYMLPGILEALVVTLREWQNVQLYTSGIKNILSFPEFSDLGKAKAIFQTLEEKDVLVTLFDNSADSSLQIVIGSENNLNHMRDCSIIKTTYSLGDDVFGTIGIIGPTRMDYSQAVSVLKYIVGNISQVISRFEDG